MNIDIKGVAPSLQIGVLYKGKVIDKTKIGKPAEYFDLASLTKIIFTVSEFIALEKKKKLKATDKVQKYWKEFPYKDVRIKDLLTHSAGFEAWKPYYKTVKTREQLRKRLLKEKRSKRKRSVYSDIDFLILSVVLEEIHGKNLENIWKARAKEMGLSNIHFCSNNKPKKKKSQYAKAEKQQGIVHDDNTRALGGVSTHAGLFGRLEDVLKYAQWVRKQYRTSSIFRKYTKRARPKRLGDWAMGFMMPSKGGSAGKYFSAQSFGHTGFTGTSFWYDPKRDLAIVILSNRVTPTRRNIKIRKIRPLIHNLIVESL